jgi:DNA-binding MarR family transcriptional regulator
MTTAPSPHHSETGISETSVTSEEELPLLMIRALKAMIADVSARKRDDEPPADGLTAIHGIAARYIDAHDDVQLNPLAAHLHVTKQSASEIVLALEREGGVIRRPHPTDGRARIIELTDHGREGLARSRARWADLMREWEGLVGPGDLEVVTRAIQAYLDAHSPDA